VPVFCESRISALFAFKEYDKVLEQGAAAAEEITS